jgi:hypothetical protein
MLKTRMVEMKILDFKLKKQLDRVSQEDILSSEMQGLLELLCSYKRDENNVQEAYQYGFMMFGMQRIENCTSNEKEEKNVYWQQELDRGKECTSRRSIYTFKGCQILN